MTLRSSLTGLVILWIGVAFAVPPAVQWEQQYGPGAFEEGRAVIQTSDGGYAVAAHSDILNTFADFMLLRLDVNGDTLWIKYYVEHNSSEIPRAIFQKPDGGFVLAGTASNYDMFMDDYRLVETDAAGNLMGIHTYSTPDYEQCTNMVPTTDGGAMLVGHRSLDSGFGVLVMKVDNTWSLQWDSLYVFYPTGSNMCNDVRQTADGGYALVGTFQNVDSTNILLAKIDASGIRQWATLLDPYGFEFGYGIDLAPGGYILAGMGNNGANGFDAIMIRTDASGTMIWSGAYGDVSFEAAYDVVATPDGGFVLCGYLYEPVIASDVFVVKSDGAGNEYWKMSFGATAGDEAVSIQNTSDGGFVLCGLRSRTDAEDQNVYIVKLLADMPLPVELVSFDARVIADGIELSFVTASETNTSRFEIWKSRGGEFALASVLEAAGNSISERRYLYVDHDVTGGTRYSYFLVDVGLNGERTEHRDRMVTVIYSASAVIPTEYAFAAYPNPFNPAATLEFSLPEATAVKIAVFDVTGREVIELANRDFETGSHRLAFDASDLPSGSYFVKLDSPNYQITRKIVLMK